MSAEAVEVDEHIKEALNRADSWSLVREMLRFAGQRDGHWAGIPMPLPDETLVVEPRYPMSREACEIIGGKMRRTTDDVESDDKPRSVFWSTHWRGEVVVWDMPGGKVECGLHFGNNSFTLMLKTVGCSDAWGVEQEAAAVRLLGEHVTHRQFKQYMLTGVFLETSKRSGVTYAFRRLRPTVAIRADARGSRILCTLCLHPIAYYASTHAGAMCPTDDVVAHLLLMRADEHMFWRRANQHPAIRPESAL